MLLRRLLVAVALRCGCAGRVFWRLDLCAGAPVAALLSVRERKKSLAFFGTGVNRNIQSDLLGWPTLLLLPAATAGCRF
jgi:hypothetical protein